MTTTIEPGDLSQLREGGLAAAGQYTALAALATRQAGEQALAELAGCCADDTAFIWWWALVRQSPDRFGSARQLPARVDVPDRLVDQVRAHVVVPLTPQEGQRPSQASVSRAEILRRLDPKAPWVVDLAHEVIAQPGDRTPGLVDAALDILGASGRQEDRAVVLEFADGLNYAKRGAALARLGGPIGTEEARRIAESLTEMKARGAERPDWEPVARLLPRFPVDVAAYYLREPFRHGTGRRTLLEAGVIRALGPELLRHVLERIDDHAVVAELLDRAAADLPEPDVAAFAEWAHARYDAQLCAGLRGRLARGLHNRHRGGDDDPGQRAKDGLWACALAGQGADAIAHELVAAVDATELPARATDVETEHAAGQLGVVAAKLLAAVDGRLPAAEVTTVQQLVDAVAQAARALRPELAPAFFAELARTATETAAIPRLRGAILDAVIESDDSIAAFACAGGVDVLTDHAAGTPADAARVLLAGRAHLAATHAITLLGAQPDRSGQRPGVDWTTADTETYLQIVEVIGAWPQAVFGVLSQALAALDEPEARHPSAAVLRALMTQAEGHGLTNELGDDTNEHLRQLLNKQRDPDVLRAACGWIRRLDLDVASADLDRAQLVLDADEARAHRQPDLSALRRELAERHAQRAQDPALEGEQRVAHLATAAQLDAASGRRAALQLANSQTISVRLAAATTLAETTGSPEEHETLAALAEAEDHAEVAKHLRAALHRLTSGDTGEALRNLAAMLELPADGLDPDVLIPDHEHQDRFTEWADKTRARSADSHDPGAFIEAAINVADQMVDLALIARQDAGQRLLKPEQVEALRTNAMNRQDVGALIKQQQLVNTFGWFPTVAALRQKRTAHPSRIGTTAPTRLRSDDVIVATSLLRDITDGWMRDMHESAQRRAGSAEPR